MPNIQKFQWLWNMNIVSQRHYDTVLPNLKEMRRERIFSVITRDKLDLNVFLIYELDNANIEPNRD